MRTVLPQLSTWAGWVVLVACAGFACMTTGGLALFVPAMALLVFHVRITTMPTFRDTWDAELYDMVRRECP